MEMENKMTEVVRLLLDASTENCAHRIFNGYKTFYGIEDAGYAVEIYGCDLRKSNRSCTKTCDKWEADDE